MSATGPILLAVPDDSTIKEELAQVPDLDVELRTTTPNGDERGSSLLPEVGLVVVETSLLVDGMEFTQNERARVPVVYVSQSEAGSHEVEMPPQALETADRAQRSLVLQVNAALSNRHTVPYDTVVRTLQGTFTDGQPETLDEASNRVVDAVIDIVGLPRAAVLLFDEEEGLLYPVARSPPLAGEAELRPFGPSDPGVWYAFVREQSVVFDAKRDPFGDGAALAQSTIAAPIGDVGVLIAGTRQADILDQSVIDAVELLSSRATLALDRIRSKRERRSLERQLEQQSERLDRIQQINDKVRKMDQALIQAKTRNEIEHIVCERLLTSDRFSFAWIGAVESQDADLRVRSKAGDDHGYLDTVPFLFDDTREHEPALQALQTGEVTVVSKIADGLHDEAWREEALLRDFLSVASIPLTYGETRYGVVTVYASTPNAFDELAVSVLSEMGETIGYAIDAAERKAALLGETVTELDLWIRAPSDIFSNLARRLDCRLDIESLTRRSDSTYVVYVRIGDASIEDITRIVDSSETIDVESRVTELESGLYELVVSSSCVPVTLADLGAIPHSISIADDRADVTLTLPDRTGVRSFLEQVESVYSQISLVAQRERELSPSGIADGQLGEELTDRQREVLETAYYNGFFEWPRERTGEEVAETLGISQPAFLQNIRAVEQKLAKLLCTRDP